MTKMRLIAAPGWWLTVASYDIDNDIGDATTHAIAGWSSRGRPFITSRGFSVLTTFAPTPDEYAVIWHYHAGDHDDDGQPLTWGEVNDEHMNTAMLWAERWAHVDANTHDDDDPTPPPDNIVGLNGRRHT